MSKRKKLKTSKASRFAKSFKAIIHLFAELIKNKYWIPLALSTILTIWLSSRVDKHFFFKKLITLSEADIQIDPINILIFLSTSYFSYLLWKVNKSQVFIESQRDKVFPVIEIKPQTINEKRHLKATIFNPSDKAIKVNFTYQYSIPIQDMFKDEAFKGKQITILRKEEVANQNFEKKYVSEDITLNELGQEIKIKNSDLFNEELIERYTVLSDIEFKTEPTLIYPGKKVKQLLITYHSLSPPRKDQNLKVKIVMETRVFGRDDIKVLEYTIDYNSIYGYLF